MRCVIGLAIILGGLFWFAATIDLKASLVNRQEIVNSPWRRTKEGWQRADRWPSDVRSAEPIELLGIVAMTRPSMPHPLIVALLMLLPSLFFLFAFSNKPQAK